MAQSASKPPLVLIANHQEWSGRSLESILTPNGYAVLRAYTGRQALEQASSAHPDLFILDANLPDVAGIDLCRELRAARYVNDSTPILVTIADEPTTRYRRLEALRAGAWDFIGLPIDAEELLLKLGSYVRAKFDADAAREEGLLDQLTGLYNVRGLLRRARELGSDASRRQRPFACVVFAPDLPTGRGERKGSAAEDPASALDELAEVFRADSRGSDAVGRLGQSEFVVLAPDTDAEGALRLAERLSNAAERRTAPMTAEKRGGIPLRLRAGCYAVPNFGDASIEPVEMLVRATKALRTAQTGGNGERIRFFDRDGPSMS